MAFLTLGPGEGLHYEYDPPGEAGQSFVFVNALTGNTGMWQAEIGPALRALGYGTLAYNLRGQQDSPFSPGTQLDDGLVAGDLVRLLDAVAPPRPILVGLSIGGLFAARAWLRGDAAEGLVLINTLRRPGPRLDWINRGMARAARTGGLQLLMDLYLPLLVNEEKLTALRPTCLGEDPYEPLDPAHGHMNLLTWAAEADWDLPYERLDLPVLVMTGLQDRVFYEASALASLSARLPRARQTTLDDAGHLIPLERPAETAQALLDFAKDL
jgi:pimeloyl-ACP methyl ester carboxylesterase